MSNIYKTPQGFYVDLAKIILIRPASFVNHMGTGGWFVSYSIEAQLREQPIVFTRALDHQEYEFDGRHKLRMTDGSLEHGEVPGKTPLCVAKLQTEVDQLVTAWEAAS